MNNDNENEVMEEANGEAEAAEVAQRAQEVVGEAAAHVAEGLRQLRPRRKQSAAVPRRLRRRAGCGSGPRSDAPNNKA